MASSGFFGTYKAGELQARANRQTADGQIAVDAPPRHKIFGRRCYPVAAGFAACPKAPAAIDDAILGKLRGWQFLSRRKLVPVAVKLAGIGPVEVAAVPLIVECERLSLW